MKKICERYPGKFYVRVQVEGKRQWIKLGHTKSEARENLKKLEKKLLLDSLDIPGFPEKKKIPKVLFEELARQYLEHCEAEKSPRTTRNELKRINSLWLPLLKGKYLDEITPLEIQKWKESRIKNNISQRTLFNDLQVLKTMFAKASMWEMVTERDPVGKLPKLFKKEIKIYTPDEARKYLSECSTSFYPIAVTLLYTGMRPIELINLEKSHVDFKNNIISISPTASLKNIYGRKIPIHNRLLPILKMQCESSQFVYVFSGKKGKRVNLRNAHVEARMRAGLPELRLYHLRHMFASILLAEGKDPAAVAVLMGHGGLEITMEIYHHLHPDRARKVIDSFPDIIPPEKSGL